MVKPEQLMEYISMWRDWRDIFLKDFLRHPSFSVVRKFVKGVGLDTSWLDHGGEKRGEIFPLMASPGFRPKWITSYTETEGEINPINRPLQQRPGR